MAAKNELSAAKLTQSAGPPPCNGQHCRYATQLAEAQAHIQTLQLFKTEIAAKLRRVAVDEFGYVTAAAAARPPPNQKQ